MRWCWAVGRLLVLSWRLMHAYWPQSCRLVGWCGVGVHEHFERLLAG